ncbi:hypothetical protein ACMH5Q_10195 [Aquirufa lenticrescens]
MLFKLIALILVMVYVVMPLLRFLLKGFVITQAHKMMSEQEIRSKQAASKARKEGSIDVDFVPPKTKTKTDDVGGDYVPYEEIKD